MAVKKSLSKTQRKPKLNLDQVMVKMIELLLRHDPQTLNYSKISRFIGIPRATLYYYFGSDLNKTFEEITRFGFNHFAQLESLDKAKDFDTWEDYQNKRLGRACSVVEQFPWAPRLYFRYRESQHTVGAIIRELEKKYLLGIRNAWKHFHKNTPEPRHQQIAGALKLGFLFGIALEAIEKKGPIFSSSESDQQKMIKKINEVCTRLLSEEI